MGQIDKRLYASLQTIFPHLVKQQGDHDRHDLSGNNFQAGNIDGVPKHPERIWHIHHIAEMLQSHPRIIEKRAAGRNLTNANDKPNRGT